MVQVWTGSRASKARLQLRSRHLPCWLCGQSIDYTLTKADDMSFSLDHIKPKSQYPDLMYEPTNWAPAHLKCNKERGTRSPSPGLGLTSEAW